MIMFKLFKSKSKIPAEDKFWSWFVSNKSKLEQFIDSDHHDVSIYHELTRQIKKYNRHLFAELTKSVTNDYILIITPDGIKDGVAATKSLSDAHPVIDHWEIKRFRQPVDEILLNFNGVQFPSSDIEILPKINRERGLVDIEVFIRNMNNDENSYKSLAFLYLDHILGEFNTITKVGYIDFHNLEEDKTVDESISVLELRNLIASELYQSNNPKQRPGSQRIGK
jgi:hypothetical protein